MRIGKGGLAYAYFPAMTSSKRFSGELFSFRIFFFFSFFLPLGFVVCPGCVFMLYLFPLSVSELIVRQQAANNNSLYGTSQPRTLL
jgi:hypothetical protein